MTTPRVSVLIVTWNVRGPVLDCLRSLPAAFASTPYEVLVVDNRSSDGTASAVRTAFPHVALIESPVNDGFGAGINRAAGPAAGEFLLVLNPDTTVEPGAGDRLVALLDSDPTVAAAAPRLLAPDGTPQPSRRRFPTPATLFFESTPLQELLRGPAGIDRYYVTDQPDDVAQTVDWIVGAAFLIRRSVFEALNGFDPSFFLYFEETDLFRRLRAYRLGQVRYDPGARVVHAGGASADQDLGQRHRRFQDSRVRYAHRHFGREMARVLRAWLWLLSAWQLAIESAKFLVGHRRDLRRRRIRNLGSALAAGLRPA